MTHRATRSAASERTGRQNNS